MAVTQADIDALQAVINSGVLTVVFDGPPRRQITYQSTDAMKRHLSDMKAELAASSGTTVRTHRTAIIDKGL